MPSTKYRYLIRPDGTIRVASKSLVAPNDTDFQVSLTPYYEPGKYFWDFSSSQMMAYTDEQLAARRQGRRAAQEEKAALLEQKKARLSHLLSTLSLEQAEVVALVAELGGVKLD